MKNVVRKLCDAYKARNIVTIDENIDRHDFKFFDSKTQDDVLKQGWVKKRGVFIRSWKPRFLILKSDGVLFGFEKKGEDLRMVNHFDVRGCQVMSLKKPMHSILIRFVGKSSKFVQRLICVDTEDEKISWINAFKSVASKSCLESQPSTQVSSLEDLYENNDFDSSKDRISFKRLEFLYILGVGTFGKVYLCRDTKTSNYYAVKKLSKASIIENKQVENTVRENRILQTIRHPFLVDMKQSFQTADNLFFVMEFANGGDLYYHLSKNRTFSEDQVRFYGGEMTLALSYLHESGIIYRDLKLENVLVDQEGHIKIADFGLSKDGMTREVRTLTHCGTAEYLAPEVIYTKIGYNFAVDWWSLGVVMYEMLHGKLPFYAKGRRYLYKLILHTEAPFPGIFSDEAENLLQGLLVKNPARRLGSGNQDAGEIMDHEFFSSMDWDKLYGKQIQPPFVPNLRSHSDLKYFDTNFTTRTVELASIEDGCTSRVDLHIGDEIEKFEDFDCIIEDLGQ